MVSCNFEFALTKFLGFVFEAIDKNTGSKVALKRTIIVGNTVSREFEVLSLVKGCPNVVQMLDFFYTFDPKKRMIQNIVMEFCEMSLENKLREFKYKPTGMPMSQVKHFCK